MCDKDCDICNGEGSFTNDSVFDLVFTDNLDVGWCEECQDFFQLDENGEVECNCNNDFKLDPHKELNFNE